MADHRRAEALQQLTLSRVHITPRLLEGSPRRIARQFGSPWAPVERLAQHLHGLPTALAQFLIHIPRGHIVLTSGISCYEVSTRFLRAQELEAVAFISLTDLVEEPISALHMVGHLLDHLLGCQGDPIGGWLSDGHGLNRSWVEIGRQVPSLFGLGYAIDEMAATNARQYFARSVAWYIQDRQRLNVTDPLIERLLRQSLFSEGFCQRALPLGHA